MTRKVADLFDVAGAQQNLQSAVQGEAQGQAMRRIAQALGLGLGAGMAGRSALGAAQALRRRYAGRSPGWANPGVIQVPYRDPASPETQEKQGSLGSALQGAAKGSASFLRGDNASTALGVPWFLPGMLLGGVGGAVAGWKGVGAALNAQRRARMEKEEEQARREFDEALLGNYTAPKQASAEPSLGETLDELHGVIKAAISQLIPSADTAGALTGLYGAAAIPAAAIPAMVAYGWAKKRQKRTLLDRAEKLRARRMAALRPPEIYAQPVPWSAAS